MTTVVSCSLTDYGDLFITRQALVEKCVSVYIGRVEKDEQWYINDLKPAVYPLCSDVLMNRVLFPWKFLEALLYGPFDPLWLTSTQFSSASTVVTLGLTAPTHSLTVTWELHCLAFLVDVSGPYQPRWKTAALHSYLVLTGLWMWICVLCHRGFQQGVCYGNMGGLSFRLLLDLHGVLLHTQ